MTWKVFAVFYTEESFNYIVSDPGASGLQYIINEAKARSLHDFAVDVNSSDKIPHPVHLYPCLWSDQPAALCCHGTPDASG